MDPNNAIKDQITVSVSLNIISRKYTRLHTHLHNLMREARLRAGRVARPRGQLIRQLGSGLLMGKLAHCLPVVARPRLPGSTGTIPETLALVQVAVNNVARSVVSHRREDHIPIVDLLEAAKFLSLNQQVVRATAMSAWSAYISNDGTGGMRNPVSSWMFGNVDQPATARPTRVRGPAPDEGDGHPRDSRPQDVERVRGAGRRTVQG
jgi:hypothetical protein